MTYNAPVTWAVGNRFTAALANAQLRDNLLELADPWTSYTPTWTASTTNPTLGNGTVTGNFIEFGKWIKARIIVTIGSTTTVGTGIYSVTLPVACNVVSGVALGCAHFSDSSAPGVPYEGVAWRSGIGATALSATFNNARWGAAAPVVPATGDVISFLLEYEAA